MHLEKVLVLTRSKIVHWIGLTAIKGGNVAYAYCIGVENGVACFDFA